jgi:ribA/ribD-fused uncharacterized protein
VSPAHEEIFAFTDSYEFLSNFYPWFVQFEGQSYPTAEHAYQAAKFRDPKDRQLIAQCTTPGRAKKAAHAMTWRADPTFPERKLEVMEVVLRDKFMPRSRMADKLIATIPCQLIEGNNHGDRYWGVCKGAGFNHLGKILMTIRDSLVESSCNS